MFQPDVKYKMGLMSLHTALSCREVVVIFPMEKKKKTEKKAVHVAFEIQNKNWKAKLPDEHECQPASGVLGDCC